MNAPTAKVWCKCGRYLVGVDETLADRRGVPHQASACEGLPPRPQIYDYPEWMRTAAPPPAPSFPWALASAFVGVAIGIILTLLAVGLR